MAEEKSLNKYVLSMLNNGHSRNAIAQDLREKGHEEQSVTELIAESLKLRANQQRSTGLYLILGGALICFLSFFLTITSSYTAGIFSLVLYGLSSAGIIVVFAGLMKVF